MSSTDTKPCGCTCPCNCTEPKPNPTPKPTPTEEDKGRPQPEKGADKNPHNWKVVGMNDADKKELFKVVDKDNINVADLFKTKEGAQKFIDDAIKVFDSKPQPQPKPDEPKPEPKPDPTPQGKVMKIIYPSPAIPKCEDKDDDEHKAVLPNNDNLSKQNKGIKHSEKLPLLSKLDKYGEPYTNIPALLKLCGITLTKVEGKCGSVKDYNYSNERTDPYENNNSGGQSKRLDMKGSPMSQDEYQLWIYNQSKDSGDETSYKHGGPHNDDINYQADCLIIQIGNDGKSCRTQTEPSHMDDDPYGYGKKFNVIDPGLPSLLGKKYIVRFIRIIDLTKLDIINFVAIKIPGDAKFGEYTLIYESHCFGGFDGDRGLKDPFVQWVVSALNSPKSAGQTVRFDKQPKHNMKKGVDYDKARLTEIVDYA